MTPSRIKRKAGRMIANSTTAVPRSPRTRSMRRSRCPSRRTCERALAKIPLLPSGDDATERRSDRVECPGKGVGDAGEGGDEGERDDADDEGVLDEGLTLFVLQYASCSLQDVAPSDAWPANASGAVGTAVAAVERRRRRHSFPSASYETAALRVLEMKLKMPSRAVVIVFSAATSTTDTSAMISAYSTRV